MDRKLTEELGKWLELDRQERDWKAGAMMLLKLSGNRYLANTVVRFPERHREYIEKKLKGYYDYRLAELTHEQVKEMCQKVDRMAQSLKIDQSEEIVEKVYITGKRADHDSLPDEIIAKYVENRSILNKMRELHTALRLTMKEEHTCVDSEMFPYLTELINLDKIYHKNWEVYDMYKVEKEKPKVKRVKNKKQ